MGDSALPDYQQLAWLVTFPKTYPQKVVLQDLPELTISLFHIRENKRVPPAFWANRAQSRFRAWRCDTVKRGKDWQVRQREIFYLYSLFTPDLHVLFPRFCDLTEGVPR